MFPLILCILLLAATPAVQAESLSVDSMAWNATDLLDNGKWEEAVKQSDMLWQRCQSEHITDIETRLLVLQTLCDGLQYMGRTEQAMAYTRIRYHIAMEGGSEYEQEQIEALLDMARLNAGMADIPRALHCATDALDRMNAYVTRRMPEWIANADVEGIVAACELAEDVSFACLNAIEDSYTAADEQHKNMLRDSMDMDQRIGKMQMFCSTMNGMTQAAKGKRREALEAVNSLYRHLLCHTLLLAQRMQPEDEVSQRRGRQYVEQVLQFAHEDEPAYIRAMARMAACHTLAGNYDSTLVWLDRLRQLDNDGSYRHVIEENKAWIAAVIKDWQTALPLLRHRYKTKKDELIQDFYYMTAEARQHIWLSKYLWYFKQNISLCTGEDFPPEVQAFLYDNILSEKGILLSAETEILSMLRRQGRSADVVCDSLYALRKSRQLISSTAEAEQYSRRLQHLLDSSHSLSSLTHLLNLNYRDVQKALSANDVAVEFLLTDDGEEGQMYALVLRSRWKAPKLVHLGACSTFVPLQQNRRKLLDHTYTQKVWEPVLQAGQVAVGERIYFAPDGPFYLTGIEYLLVDSMHTMADTYEMYRLSSTRELCRKNTHTPHIQSDTTVLYGGVCYDTEGIRSSVKYLPATLAEVAALDSILPIATIHTCTEASEQAFKSMSSHSPRILHIATHGFFLPVQQASTTARDWLQSRLSDEGTVNIEDYALSRAGLLMAGAGAAWGEQSYKLKDDGVLTAKEIGMLDLGHTDLVVLSACQTGLGDITVDGVAGLQRGFKKAGCGSMLLSLWSVDDEATKILITEFYKHLAEGKTTTQALREAQYYLRTFTRVPAPDNLAEPALQQRARPYLRSSHSRKEDDRYPYASPYFWAAFVLLDAK